MRWFSALLAVLISVQSAWATAYTSNTSGGWGTTTIWTPNGTPGNGDTITIAAGHTVTTGTNRTIGTSGVAGTAAVTVATGSQLTITDGTTFVLRGDMILQGTGRAQVNGGGIFEFDSSAAASPSTTAYKVQIADTHNQQARFICGGYDEAHRVIVRSNSGGANGYFTDGTVLQGGSMDCDYTDFLRIGSSTTPAITTWPSSAATFRIKHSTFTSCGRIDQTSGIGGDSTYVLQYVNFSSTLDPDMPLKISASAAKTGGTRLLDYNYFDKNVQMYGPLDFTITNNVFNDYFVTTASIWASFTGNFVRMTSATAGVRLYGSTSNNFFFYDGAADSNPHFAQVDTTTTHAGNVFQSNNSAGDGDCYLFGTPGSAFTVTLTGNLVLPNAAGESSGTLFSQLGDASLTFSADGNTVFSGSQGAAVGESYAGHTGILSSFKDNIFYDTSARGYKLYDSGGNDAVSNLVTSANANYNVGYNLLTGSNGKGYNNLEFSSGSPGANDVDGQNPNFVNSAARLATWNGAGTEAAALAEVRKIGTAAFNTNYTPSNLVTYLKDAFKIQNATLSTASSSSGAPGCCGYQALSTKRNSDGLG